MLSAAVNSVRLACVRHAASVRSEPGSNSQLKLLGLTLQFSKNHSATTWGHELQALTHALTATRWLPQLNIIPGITEKIKRLYSDSIASFYHIPIKVTRIIQIIIQIQCTYCIFRYRIAFLKSQSIDKYIKLYQNIFEISQIILNYA